MFQRQAWVYCVPLPDSSGQLQQLWVSADGTINTSQMAPGAYRVMAFADQQPNLPFRDPEAMRAYESKGQVVHLSAGQKTSVQLQLIPSIE
jgi:sucrose-6-phosphate hydrolase SacC (GH32 family)